MKTRGEHLETSRRLYECRFCPRVAPLARPRCVLGPARGSRQLRAPAPPRARAKLLRAPPGGIRRPPLPQKAAAAPQAAARQPAPAPSRAELTACAHGLRPAASQGRLQASG